MSNENKTAAKILKENYNAFPFDKIKIIKAMEEYANQFKYDYSKNCICESRIGETWCCNQCGLPTKKVDKTNVISKIREQIQKRANISTGDYQSAFLMALNVIDQIIKEK